MHFNVAAQRLISTIKYILSDNHCKGLTHFIFITAVPYPLCFDNDDCNSNRIYRINPAIRALNEYYLSKLLLIQIHSPIKLSIIDAYSIAMPRLLFHPDEEVVCINHYLCREEFDNRIYTVHAPAG